MVKVKWRLIWPGKCRQPQLASLIHDYHQRITKMVPCELVESGEAKGVPEKEKQKVLKIEADNLAKNIRSGYIICLSDQGEEMTTKGFKDFLEKLMLSSVKTVNFIVGGFLGLDDSILAKADKIISLSPMTFSHETIRLMLIEQLYRVITMTRGLKYAK
ncbi:MAG TPA: 23S rRNA (pseudouridine(1915)-N(3))-methyltransferase RlmH [Candidatus Aminicenantes bacterium]|nr:23S rRNA (pseudouridine(1915)-N(3))-methyltransferase RlmH [Candidatus Aminicenantes bacterium]